MRNKKRDVALSRQLGLDRPYDWSNKNIPETTLALLVLQGGHLPDITRAAHYFGGKLMRNQLGHIKEDLTRKIAHRKLSNVLIAIGADHA